MKIQHGKKFVRTKFPVSHKCEHCHSILSVDLDDLYPECPPGGEYASDILADCPVCQLPTVVDFTILDEFTKSEVRGRIPRNGTGAFMFVVGKVLDPRLLIACVIIWGVVVLVIDIIF